MYIARSLFKKGLLVRNATPYLRTCEQYEEERRRHTAVLLQVGQSVFTGNTGECYPHGSIVECGSCLLSTYSWRSHLYRSLTLTELHNFYSSSSVLTYLDHSSDAWLNRGH